MPLRRSLLTLAIATGVVAAAAIASPALASTSASSTTGSMHAAFWLENGADSVEWELKPVDALHAPVAGGHPSGATGSFVNMNVTGLAAGVYTLQVVPFQHGTVMQMFSATTFTVHAGQQTGLGTVGLQHTLLTLRGSAPTGAFVDLHEVGSKSALPPVHTFEDGGRYIVYAMIPGTYRLTVSKSGYAPRSYTVLIREPHQDVALGKKLG